MRIGDGDALEATFNYPNGIVANGEGKIFVHEINPRVATEGIKEELRTGRVRLISLPSLTDELSALYVSKGSDAMVEAYRVARSSNQDLRTERRIVPGVLAGL